MELEHNLLTVKDGKILYNGTMMELFIPDEYFKSGLAEIVGTGYNVFGYARAYHYTSKDDDRSKAHKSILTYPLKFQTNPSQVEIENITFNNIKEKYHVFTYFKNDVVFTSNELIQNAMNVQVFFEMLMAGKLDIVEYRLIPRLFQLCKNWNKIDLGTPAMYEEVIIADYYRNPDDPSKPARFEAAITNKKPFYAMGITQREKVGFTSTFAALTFEDLTSALTQADNNKRDGKEEIISDTEKVSLGLI